VSEGEAEPDDPEQGQQRDDPARPRPAGEKHQQDRKEQRDRRPQVRL
jgi:hypothetical protein